MQRGESGEQGIDEVGQTREPGGGVGNEGWERYIVQAVVIT